MPHPLDVRKDNIWEYAQNKPRLIADDLLSLADVPREVTYKVLLARGVFKWLAVRRDLIKLKNVWRDRITNTIATIHRGKDAVRRADNDAERQELREYLAWHRGYLKAYEECRKEVRALCHSDRWRAPDFDREATAFLRDLEESVPTETAAD